MDDYGITSFQVSSARPTVSDHSEEEQFRKQFEPVHPQLQNARWIDLSRIPSRGASRALAHRVTALMIPYLDHKCLLGPDRLDTLRRNTGILLAGILRAAFRGHLVSAQRSPSGGLWVGSVIRHAAAWRILEALTRADLIGQTQSVLTNQLAEDDPTVPGLATMIWPTSNLIELAERVGVTGATIAADWATNPRAERRTVPVARDDLVTAYSLSCDKQKRRSLVGQPAEAEAIKFGVAQLNDQVRLVPITGCPAPAFRRIFWGNLQLGGRFYAVGGSNYQNMLREDRALIRIGGEAVVEVHVHAAFLTLLLGLFGVRRLPAEDLYVAVGLPRAATKAWMLQTFATGNPATRWGRGTPNEVARLGIEAFEVCEAALRTYPAISNLRQIVLTEPLRRLPDDRHTWAVGQHLVNLESRVMDRTLFYVRARGAVGLPMRDSIIVPASASALAAEGLRRACWEVAQIEPRVKVSGSE